MDKKETNYSICAHASLVFSEKKLRGDILFNFKTEDNENPKV
jgi:hypothetical protein